MKYYTQDDIKNLVADIDGIVALGRPSSATAAQLLAIKDSLLSCKRVMCKDDVTCVRDALDECNLQRISDRGFVEFLKLTMLGVMLSPPRIGRPIAMGELMSLYLKHGLIARETYKVCKLLADKRYREFRKPSFSPGDMAIDVNGQHPVMIVEGPHVKSYELVYTVLDSELRDIEWDLLSRLT